ncbi:putative N-acetyltransferase domain-containing protein [Seiridium cardinale]
MATTNLQFRIATQDDAAKIQELVQSAFRADDSRENWTGDKELSAEFRAGFRIDIGDIMAKITKPDSAVLMAIDDYGNLVGSVETFKRSSELARISMLAVDQRYQRGGVGRQILVHAEHYCQRTWSIAQMGLNALSTRQELILWYERRGYVRTGETTPFPRLHSAGFKLPEDLCFIELEKDITVSVSS